MGVNYYKDTYRYPYMAEATLNTLKYYMASMLFPDEDYLTQSKKRMIRTDFINAGDEEAIRRCIDEFKANQANIPFCAYAIDENEVAVEVMSNFQESGHYFSEKTGCYVKSTPINFQFPMMAFFSTAHDYWRAKQVMQDAISGDIGAEMIYIPMTFQTSDDGSSPSYDIVVPAKIGAEVTKGSLAFAFNEYLRVGKIFNISFNITVQSHFLEFNRKKNYMDSSGVMQSGNLIPRPVDEMILNWNLITTGELNPSYEIETTSNYITPEITITAPTEDETGFDVDSPIIINFNTPMNEDSVINNLDVVPWFDYRVAWDSDSKQLIIDPTSSLSTSTEYEITINDNAKSYVDQNLEEDFVLTFTTEA